MAGRLYGILGDIHGNWDALEAVLSDACGLGVTDFVCVGDVVGYNAEPVRCLDKIMELDGLTVQGNHDYYCAIDIPLFDLHPLAAEVLRWTRAQLGPRHIRYLRNLKLTGRFEGVTAVHSTLDMPERWGYVFDAIEADANFSYQSTQACVNGHTHVPIVFERDGRVRRNPFTEVRLAAGVQYFINVGSVGQPRDGDPRAAYAIFDPGLKTFRLRRIPYDVEAAQGRIRQSGLPERLAERLATGH